MQPNLSSSWAIDLVCSPHTYIIPLRALTRPSPPPLPTGSTTGSVSFIQTVGGSSDASCLTSEVSPMSSFFTLSPLKPSQCSDQVISWNSTRYQEPPVILGFVLGGPAITLVRPSTNSATYAQWEVNIREGTPFLYLVQPPISSEDSTGNNDARTSPLITVTGKGSRGDSCLNTRSSNGFTATATTVPGPSDPHGNVK